MLRVVVIEDDKAVSRQLRGWIERALPEVRVDACHTREEAEQAIAHTTYDLIVLDVELGAERNAGVALIKTATRTAAVPVLVVSGMPADLYRGVMKALDAWDYLQKPVEEHDFAQTLLDILRLVKVQKQDQQQLQLDPLRQPKPMWKGRRLNLPATAQRILSAIYERRQAKDTTVSYVELYEAVASGKNKENVRRQIAIMKAAFREIDPAFDCIVSEPMRGYRWVDRS